MMVMSLEDVRRQIEKDVGQMVKEKLIGKDDVDAMKMVMALFYFGADKEKVRKVAGCSKFDFYWNNLEKNHYFSEDGQIMLEGDEGDDFFFMLSVLLMLMTAKGYVKRVKR